MKRFRVVHMRHPSAQDNAVDIVEASYYRVERDRVATFWISTARGEEDRRIKTFFHPMVIEEEHLADV